MGDVDAKVIRKRFNVPSNVSAVTIIGDRIWVAGREITPAELRLLDLIRSGEMVAVPAGLTPEMLLAASRRISGHLKPNTLTALYRAMLAAAPKPEDEG